jgi:signal transduction histidine kinase/ligand-binding sensor protein
MPIYQQIVQPKNILDLLEKPLLESFLRGYNNYTLSGVAIYFLRNNSLDIILDEDIEYINPINGNPTNKNNYNPICKYYRATCNQEKNCIQFDKRIVRRYYSEKNTNPLLYRCHVQMWDMAYPIWLNNILYGVLFAGQLLNSRRIGEIDWQNELREIAEYVDFKSFDLNKTISNQCEDVINSISKNTYIDKSKQNELIELVKNDETNGNCITIEDLISRFKDFQSFGKLTEELFNKLYQSKKDAFDLQEQNSHSIFENECIKELAETRPKNLVSWQSSLQKVLSKIQMKYSFIERIGIFHDQKGEKAEKNEDKITFDLVAMNSSKWWDHQPVIVRKNQLLEFNRNFNFIKLYNNLYGAVGEKLASKKKFIVYSHVNESTQIFTLIIIQSDEYLKEIDIKHKNQIISLLGRFFRLDEIVRLNLREIESNEAFEKHVELTRHDLRTSAQYIIGNVDKYDILLKKRFSYVSSELQVQRIMIDTAIEEHTSRIEKLTADINSILTDKPQSINITDAIIKNIDLFRATAQNRMIKLKYSVGDSNPLTTNVFVVCEYSELNRAIAALIDNAIKYSYDNSEILISSCCMNGNFTFQIENYGIGIPENKLEKIKQMGERGEVQDFVRNRPGTGMGIYIANLIFAEMLNGKIEYSSIKDPNPIYKDAKEYHNYLTRVKVIIPI